MASPSRAPRILSTASFVVGVVLIAIAIFFFLEAVTYIQAPSTSVVAGLLSAVIGFATLSAGTSLIRSYLISKVTENK